MLILNGIDSSKLRAELDKMGKQITDGISEQVTKVEKEVKNISNFGKTEK